MPPRVLLAWEGGAGRGHVVTLKVIAEALGTAAICDAALCRMDHAAEIAPFCEGVFPGARLWPNRSRREAAGNPRAATWGDFLGDLNFWDAGFLVTQIDWWLKTIRARQSRLVVADFAPCAQLAARVAGIPSVAVGTGYSVPPAGVDRFPVLLPEFTDLVFDEAELLDAVNRALAHFGALPLKRLSDIYAGAAAMPRTIPGLDPYTDLRQAPLLPPLNEKLPRPDGGGDEIFLYFSTSETGNAALVEAITGLGLPIRAFLPGADAGVKTRFADAGIVVEERPVPVEDIGRRSRLMIHSGQHGSLCMGLGLGLPQIAVPQHLEHLFHARKAATLAPVAIIDPGMTEPADISALIKATCRDDGRVEAARTAAERLRPDLFGDIAAITRGQLLPLMD
ncbi:hypothetical protein DMC47_14115 [Nostoc sp. 3335mG]|nr:hypothetical protein DMC47_14115 [Nostoc sp. 3335mG]